MAGNVSPIWREFATLLLPLPPPSLSLFFIFPPPVFQSCVHNTFSTIIMSKNLKKENKYATLFFRNNHIFAFSFAC